MSQTISDDGTTLIVEASTPDELFEYLLPDKAHWGSSRIPDWVFRGVYGDFDLLPSAWRQNVIESAEWGFQRHRAKNFAAKWVSEFEAANEKLRTTLRNFSFPPVPDRQRLLTLVEQVWWEQQLVARFVELADEIGFAVSAEGHGVGLPGYLFVDESPRDDYRTFEPFIAFAFAQHHRVPTRLLDWTRRPLVSTYFAASAHLTHRVKRESNFVIWALNVRELPQPNREADHRIHLEESPLGIEVLPGRRAGHSYLHAQDGLFTWVTGWEHHVLTHGKLPSISDALVALRKGNHIRGEPILRKIVVSTVHAKEVVRRLLRHHVSKHHLMPTLDNVAEVMKFESVLPVGIDDGYHAPDYLPPQV